MINKEVVILDFFTVKLRILHVIILPMVDFTTLKLVINSYLNMCSSYELTNSSHMRSAYELTHSSHMETKHALSESRIAGI